MLVRPSRGSSMLGAIRENQSQGDPFRRRNSYGAPAAHLSSPSMHSTKWHAPALVATPVRPRSLFFSRAEDWCNPLSCSRKRTRALEPGFIVCWPISIPEIIWNWSGVLYQTTIDPFVHWDRVLRHSIVPSRGEHPSSEKRSIEHHTGLLPTETWPFRWRP